MQQPGQFGFGDKAKRFSESFGFLRDVAEVRGEQLPFAGIFWQWFALVVLSGVSVIVHLGGPGTSESVWLVTLWSLGDKSYLFTLSDVREIMPARGCMISI